MSSPTKRTLDSLRKSGVPACVAEHWNAFARRRIDLFGFIDVVAIDRTMIGIQCCVMDSAAARQKKIEGIDAAASWLKAGGRIEVWGWAKRGARGKRKTWGVVIREAVLGVDGFEWHDTHNQIVKEMG